MKNLFKKKSSGQIIEFCGTISTPPYVFKLLVGKLHGRKHLQIKEGTLFKSGGELVGWFSVISCPPYNLFNLCFLSWLCVICEYNKPIFRTQIFWVPHLAWRCMRSNACSLPTKNLKTERGSALVLKNSLIWPLLFFLKLIFQQLTLPVLIFALNLRKLLSSLNCHLWMIYNSLILK